MRFGVLGPLEVRSVDGELVHVGGPRPRALLVMLLLDAGRVVGVERLVAGQYGEDVPVGAGNAVQAQVSRLRRVLGGVVEFGGGGYRLAVEPDDVDVHRFERLVGEGRRLVEAGRSEGAVEVLREALGLWRGQALVDLPHAEARVTRLEELRLTAFEHLAEAGGCSVAELRELVGAHPLRERLRVRLMRALEAAGRRGEALAEFAEARRVLAEELGADPSEELAEAHLDLLRARRPARRGVPAQLTSFTGRGRELARLAGLRDARLVTVTGPGGIGKTRLAVESARPDAVFVDLAPLTDGDQVPWAVLGALGLRESAAQGPVRRLVSALGRDQVVLDNCEHVVDAAAALVRTLLAECPDLTVLATSREPLGLTGEVLVPLAPLDVAPPDVAAEHARAYPAVRLFADRAAAVRPGFAVGPEHVAAVVRIGGGPAAPVHRRGRRRPAGRARTVPAAVARGPHGRGPAPDVDGGRAVELGPARSAGARAGRRVRRVHRGRAARRGRTGLRGHRGRAGGPGRQVAGRDRRRALGCSARTGWPSPGRRRSCAGRTPATTSTWPRGPTRTCAEPTSWSGWRCCRPSTRT